MATWKLSAEQRANLRSELVQGKQAGVRIPELVAQTSKKYSIAKITVRYYLASLNKDRRSHVAVAATRDQQQAAKANEARRLIPRLRRLQSKHLRFKRKYERIGRIVERVGKEVNALHARILELMA